MNQACLQVSTSALRGNEGKRQMYIREDIWKLSKKLLLERKDILVWSKEKGGGALCVLRMLLQK